LPLAIAQAGAYLQESKVSIEAYLRFYDQQWDKLMAAENGDNAPLDDYPDRSVWTTWAISYKAVLNKDEAAAHLLLLWSFLDNKDLWHGLFAAAGADSAIAQSMLLEWIGEAVINELEFSRAMLLLRSYSLVEAVEGAAGYTTHPVVHQWARHHQGKRFAPKLGLLAVVAVGWAVPDRSSREYAAAQRRLLPHVQAASRWVAHVHVHREAYRSGNSVEGDAKQKEQQAVFDAVHRLGNFYQEQGKLSEAERMYEPALRGKEAALGSDHTSTLGAVTSLGALYQRQGKLVEAERMYQRALRGYEEALGPNHTSTLKVVSNLGSLYKDQGKLAEAEKMCQQALRGIEEALGPNHMFTLQIVHNLGNLYADQGKLAEAEKMYKRALQGKEEALGPNHTSTLDTVNNLGNLYAKQGKLAEAEKMYERALRGSEGALGPSHTSTLDTVNNLGILYAKQGKLAEAEKMYERALRGYEEALGPNHMSTLATVNNLGLLYADQGKLAEAEKMYKRALQGKEEALGPNHTSTLNTVNNLGSKIRALSAVQAQIDRHQQLAKCYKRSQNSEEGHRRKLTVQQRIKNILRHK
jgi:tetratricopeptide (TPR) repeat protein